MPSLKVLLVDDEEELVSTLQERLELRKIDTEYVLNGREAVERVEKGDFDVVILDIMMPGISGLEVLKEIKSLRPETQVILLTGKGSIKDSEVGLNYGAFDYIIKPINIETLIEKMKEAVSRRE